MIRPEVENEVARGPVCNYCDEKLAPKQAFCGKCGHPTEHANHDERVLWDLGQWEVSRRRKASDEPKDTRRASESAERTKELFRSAQGKAAGGAEPKQQDHGNGESLGTEAPKRSFLGRSRREQTPEAPPARPAAPKPAQTPARAEPERPAARTDRERGPARPAAPTQAPPAARPDGAVRPAASTGRPAPAAPPSPATPAAKPAARKAPTMTSERPAAAASAPAPTARPVERREYASPKTKIPADAPLIMIRKTAEENRQAPAAASAPPIEAPAPAKPSRAQRKAAEEERREAERARKLEQKAAERLRDEQRKEADRRRAEQKAQQMKEEERRRKEEAKGAQKRQRKHKRHSKRVNRRAAELDLRSGERVSLSIEGWSRLRRATLVVTNYRVALVTQMPPQVRWIPLEEVSDVRHRWRGSHSLVVTSTIEVLTLQKSKKEMLASFEQLLESEVAEARRPGATERHHGDITQEWAERSTEIWDSHLRRLRLWIRRHPVVTLGSLTVCVIAAFVLTGLLTSFFSPTR